MVNLRMRKLPKTTVSDKKIVPVTDRKSVLEEMKRVRDLMRPDIAMVLIGVYFEESMPRAITVTNVSPETLRLAGMACLDMANAHEGGPVKFGDIANIEEQN